MTTKSACGVGGHSGGCGCSKTTNPYEESQRVVWHDPTDYDALKHGPSFFPGMKLAAADKSRVRAFVKSAAGKLPTDVPPEVASMDPRWKDCFILLGLLRAASFIHQSHHWLTRGPSFYGDHQLFDRIYTESQEGIDQLAERIIGSSAVSLNPLHQAWVLKAAVEFCCDAQSTASPETMVAVSLNVEAGVLQGLQKAKHALEAEGALTPGTANLLDGLYDKHETFIYLLQQRADSYTYDRR